MSIGKYFCGSVLFGYIDFAERNPVTEYRKEQLGYNSFTNMNGSEIE